MRPLPAHGAALGSGRNSRLRLLRLPLPLLLGLRLHLTYSPTGLPIIWALARPKLDERQVLIRVLDHNRHLVTGRPGQQLLPPIRQLIESVNDTPQGLTRPGTARRADPGRGQGPDRPGTARPDRRDLAQPRHRPAGYKIADRLRPLIDLGISRLGAAGGVDDPDARVRVQRTEPPDHVGRPAGTIPRPAVPHDDRVRAGIERPGDVDHPGVRPAEHVVAPTAVGVTEHADLGQPRDPFEAGRPVRPRDVDRPPDELLPGQRQAEQDPRTASVRLLDDDQVRSAGPATPHRAPRADLPGR